MRQGFGETYNSDHISHAHVTRDVLSEFSIISHWVQEIEQVGSQVQTKSRTLVYYIGTGRVKTHKLKRLIHKTSTILSTERLEAN